MLIENEKDNEFYYKEDKIIKCPHCNYKQFYVKNKTLHKCNITNQENEIEENFIKKNEKFFM